MTHDQLNMSLYCEAVVKWATVVQLCRRKEVFIKEQKSHSILLFVSNGVVVQFCLVLTSRPQSVEKLESWSKARGEVAG